MTFNVRTSCACKKCIIEESAPLTDECDVGRVVGLRARVLRRLPHVGAVLQLQHVALAPEELQAHVSRLAGMVTVLLQVLNHQSSESIPKMLADNPKMPSDELTKAFDCFEHKTLLVKLAMTAFKIKHLIPLAVL